MPTQCPGARSKDSIQSLPAEGESDAGDDALKAVAAEGGPMRRIRIPDSELSFRRRFCEQIWLSSGLCVLV